jgi:hypothetical protein
LKQSDFIDAARGNLQMMLDDQSCLFAIFFFQPLNILLMLIGEVLLPPVT